MRILYFAQWFEPEPMIKGAGFVQALIDRGHEVQVVTGFPNYPKGKLYPGYKISAHKRDMADGVQIERVALYPSHDASSVGRILNYFSYAASAALFGIFRARQFDVIYVYPPIPAALAAALVGMVRRRPFVMDIQDLWPDSVLKSEMPGVKGMKRIIEMMCQTAYRRAARIVAQSQGIAARLIERGVDPEKIDVIYNWADEEAARANGTCDLTRYGLEGKFNIVYGGNLGRLQALDVLVKAAHLARMEIPNLQLLLIGNGVEADRLKALALEIGATNVRIEPGVPRTEIGDIFAVADVLALHLDKDPLFEITIPQKTQFYMAMAKPILIGVAGEAAKFVVESGAGLAVEPGNVADVADGMVRLARMTPQERQAMGDRGRESYRTKFSFRSAVAATESSISRALSKPNAAGQGL